MDALNIEINGDFTNEVVDTIRERCITASSENIPVQLRFSTVTRVTDTAILFLIQLAEYSDNKNVSCSLLGLDKDTIDFFTVLGLSSKLDLRSDQ